MAYRHSLSNLQLTADDNAPPPVVTVTLGYTFIGSGLAGYVIAPFQGYDPAVTGQLTLALGYSAALAATTVSVLAPLKHVVTASPVATPTSVVDLAFATPSQPFFLGTEAPTLVDIGISATTPGLSGILGPLIAALVGTTLGKELAPIVSFAKGLLPTLDRNGGLPHGGSLTATPFLTAGIGFSLGAGQSGNLVIGPRYGAAIVQTVADGAGLLGNASSLLSDVQSGNFFGAVGAGAATLGSGAAVAGDIGTLIQDASQQQNPSLPAIKNPALNLNLQAQLGQSFGLGAVGPAQLSETVGVNVTADTFGAYALGKLLAQIAPQLIKDLSHQNTVRQPLDVFSQMAGDVATLARAASGGFTGISGAVAVPSSVGHADISIQLNFAITETLFGGTVGTQTLSTTLEANAQGFYDLGTLAQPAITDLLLGLLETKAGHEALQIGGDILSQLDSKLGGTAAASTNQPRIGATAHDMMPVHWHL